MSPPQAPRSEAANSASQTAVALVPPLFGPTSKLGGALCLAFFLLVQPAGTRVRAAVRTPNRSLLGGRWQGRSPVPGRARPLSFPAGISAARGKV